MTATLEQLAHFAARHAKPGVIVLPNAWDPGSAVLMAQAGFEAIATTSAGIAHSQGVPDGALGRDEMLVQIERIARAVPVPVTADLEDGYGARERMLRSPSRLRSRRGLQAATSRTVG